MIGDIIDQYQIIKKIGEGGMATVYQARHTSLNRDVAIKIIHPGLASSERNRKRFAREAKAIERLDHPNIVKIWDYSEKEGGQCYIVTELVEGLNLRQLMDEEVSIPSEVIAMISIEVCKALQYAHELGFIHRDIKPENIMIRNDGEVKLLDFGIARFHEDEGITMTRSLVGSPAYMSPEQAMDEHIDQLDHRSDLFSLGIVLFEMATEELPFHGSNPSVILKNIIDNRRMQAHSIAPQMSIQLNDCIEMLLQTNRELRLPDGQSVIRMLESVWDEASLDLQEDIWSLRYWLSDSTSYKLRLEAHLRAELIQKGQHLMNEGEVLQAQRYLNRVLVLDPDNDAVFDLLQNMHTSLDTIQEPKTRALWWYSIPVVMVGIAFIIFKPTTSKTEIVSVEVIPDLEKPELEFELEEVSESAQPAEPIKQSASPLSTTPLLQNPTVRAVRTKAKIPNRNPIQTVQKAAIPEPSKTTDTTPVSTPEASIKGTLTVSIPNAWAEIYVDEQKYGRTGQVDPIELSPGQHTLRLENPYSLSHIETVDIQPDERTHIEVRSLKRKPATLIFASTHSPECIVTMDGQDKGELGVLQFKLSVSSPNLPHELFLDCPNEQLNTIVGRLTPGSSMPVRF